VPDATRQDVRHAEGTGRHNETGGAGCGGRDRSPGADTRSAAYSCSR